MDVTVILIITDVLGTISKGFGQKARRNRDQRKDQDYTDHSIV